MRNQRTRLGAIVGACALAGTIWGCGSSGGGGGAAAPASTTGAGSSASAAAAPTAEYLTLKAESVLAAPDVASLLDRAVGATAAGGSGALSRHVLNEGLLLTARPRGQNVVLTVEADAAGARPREALAEVAVSQALGRTYCELVQAAMSTMALTSATPGLAQPWNLLLAGESPSGGGLTIDVAADAAGKFTVSFAIQSPVRPIDSVVVPVAFGAAGGPPAVEKIGGTVHFPISKSDFQLFVNRAYGYNSPQRFTDFGLIPHTWLRLTVTGDAANKVVAVHFDAIATTGGRLYVAEAPASTALGGRFFDETVARMTQMEADEARAPGSSRPWNSNFFYSSATKGVVEVVTRGERGDFDIAYRVETPVREVAP